MTTFRRNYNGYTWSTANSFTLGPGAVGGVISERSSGTNKWYHCDANGNMTQEKKNGALTRQFNYNKDDRMVLAGIPGDEYTALEYDALGRRLIRTNGATGHQTLYYYDGIRAILENTKSVGGSWTTAKVYTLQAGAIGSIISERNSSTGTNMWYHYDRLGNVSDLTDASGNIASSYEQEAFGNVLQGDAAGYHLTTKEYDADIALYYFWARWYDPTLGRFTQRAALPPDEEHPYSYCESDPLNDIDPQGLFTIDSSCECDADLWKDLNAADRESKCEEAAKKLQAQWGSKRDKILECVLDLCRGVKNRVIECESGSSEKCNGKQGYPRKRPFRKTRVVLCVGNITSPVWEVVAWEFARICGYDVY